MKETNGLTSPPNDTIIWTETRPQITVTSFFLRLWFFVRPVFEPTTSRSADRCSPNWPNLAAVSLGMTLALALKNPETNPNKRATQCFFVDQFCLKARERTLWTRLRKETKHKRQNNKICGNEFLQWIWLWKSLYLSYRSLIFVFR